MGKRKFNSALCIILTLAMLATVSGCGKKNKEAQGTSTTENTAIAEETNLSAGAITIDDGSAEKEALAAKSNEAYEAFLNNDEPVYFTYYLGSDNSKIFDWEYSAYKDAYKSGSAYVFSDFMQTCCAKMAEDAGKAVYPMDIESAIIDCGNDGVPELAIKVNGVDVGAMDFTDVWIMKYLDNKLQMLYYKQYGYRSDMILNEYGYIWYGGSSGAASHGGVNMYLNENGELLYDFGQETCLSPWALYVSGDLDADWGFLADELGIGDRIEIDQFYFEEADENEDYAIFQKNSMWIYHEMDDNFTEVVNPDIYKDGNPYKQFWDATGLPLNTEEEIEKKKAEHHKEIGLTDEVVNGKEVHWGPVDEDKIDRIYAWKPADADNIVLDEPSWEYNYWGYEAEPTTTVTLKESSKAANEIIDDDKWFNTVGMEEPDRLSFSDGTYDFKLYGEDSDGLKWYPYMMDISKAGESTPLYTLDFSNYYKPPVIAAGDDSFVEEAIHWAVIEDGILYVSTFHNTYASSGPQNGYITALDMNDNFKVLWRSEPLTCNANNFVIVGDAIVCGYGFTAEDDFVYVLDKGCGLRMGTYKVKTGPDWFFLKDNQLYVRCYDTDYVFDVSLVS